MNMQSVTIDKFVAPRRRPAEVPGIGLEGNADRKTTSRQNEEGQINALRRPRTTPCFRRGT